MNQLKMKIICEGMMIFGCGLIIGTYIIGIIAPNFYFSDFWESTMITMLTCAILFFVIQDYNTDLALLEKEKTEKDEPKGVIINN